MPILKQASFFFCRSKYHFVITIPSLYLTIVVSLQISPGLSIVHDTLPGEMPFSLLNSSENFFFQGLVYRVAKVVICPSFVLLFIGKYALCCTCMSSSLTCLIDSFLFIFFCCTFMYELGGKLLSWSCDGGSSHPAKPIGVWMLGCDNLGVLSLAQWNLRVDSRVVTCN